MTGPRRPGRGGGGPPVDSRRRCRPLTEWPEPDRAAWAAALAPGDLLDPGGPAAGWSERTRSKTAKGYGRWLTWLDQEGLLDPKAGPADRVSRTQVAAYVEHLAMINGGYTPICRIQELRDALRVLAPEYDWRWLQTVETRLKQRVVPTRAKRARLRPAADLLALGRSLMRAAEADEEATAINRAITFRDGLMIALLAARPLRLENYSALAVGRHLERRGDAWWLSIPANETKTRQPIDVPVPADLSPELERYLGHYRPVLLQRGSPGDRQSRRPLGLARGRRHAADIGLRPDRGRTRAAFGAAINPHLFRDCAATSIAVEDPAHVRIIRSVLGHTTLATAERHYNQARGLEASRRFQAIIAGFRRDVP